MPYNKFHFYLNFFFIKIFNYKFEGNILQPSTLSTSTSFQANNNGAYDNEKKTQQQVGSTWSNVNFDFDNLMGKKDTKGPVLSMNQMKSANSSPVKSPPPLSANSNFAFNQSKNNNNNNFGQFNAFQ